MVTIVISEGIPIGYTDNKHVDWWEIAKALHRNEAMELDVDDYQQNPVSYVQDMKDEYDIHVWRWNRLCNDFIEIT